MGGLGEFVQTKLLITPASNYLNTHFAVDFFDFSSITSFNLSWLSGKDSSLDPILDWVSNFNTSTYLFSSQHSGLTPRLDSSFEG